MEYIFFYTSIAIMVILFLVCCIYKKLELPSIIIGLTTIGYSLTNDILFGDIFKLFYYINPNVSTPYMLVSAIVIYPLLNIIYTMFLPLKAKAIVLYTAVWIIAMLAFEYASLVTKTIVFTGWKPIPWSIVTYFLAYLWIYSFYKYLKRNLV